MPNLPYSRVVGLERIMLFYDEGTSHIVQWWDHVVGTWNDHFPDHDNMDSARRAALILCATQEHVRIMTISVEKFR